MHVCMPTYKLLLDAALLSVHLVRLEEQPTVLPSLVHSLLITVGHGIVPHVCFCCCVPASTADGGAGVSCHPSCSCCHP